MALSLMGALQRNAPLRGPIVMDSPFGRLDEMHTTKIVQALPNMASQLMLLVYESELDPKDARNQLKGKLKKEYKKAAKQPDGRMISPSSCGGKLRLLCPCL